MRLEEARQILMLSEIVGDSNTVFSGLESDSRQVKAGDLFVAIRGAASDGHHYAQQAEQQGAVALMVEQPVDSSLPQLLVKDTRLALARLAAHYYGYPGQAMKIIGITGTNGKTTTTYLLEKILENAGIRTGLMGTIEVKINGVSREAKNTTQDALSLQRCYDQMRATNTDYCIMEVSSHALAQGRVIGTPYRSAVFTNLTQDHLDYHRSMEDYREAKGLLFSRLGNQGVEGTSALAILNADEAASSYFRRMTAAETLTYGIDQPADVQASDIVYAATGTTFLVTTPFGSQLFSMKLIGKFSVYNALAAISVALTEGISLGVIAASLQQIEGVPGRIEAVVGGQDFPVIVDYAHTPDGLENVLRAIKPITRGKLITVFGCGGDRDRTKRPLMGAISAKYSDYVFVTSDNPRSEEPSSIIADIIPGLTQEGLSEAEYECIVDRSTAIKKAVEMATSEDVVLIAGKGHETYQEIAGIRYDLDDRVVAREAIGSRLR